MFPLGQPVEHGRMKQKKRVNRYLMILLVFASILFAVISYLNTGGLREFKGVVVAKRDSDQILVVPNVDTDTIHNKTAEELLTIAWEQNGVYFSVDHEIFENVTVGTTVVVYYHPDDGEEVSIPPRRHSRRAEILRVRPE